MVTGVIMRVRGLKGFQTYMNKVVRAVPKESDKLGKRLSKQIVMFAKEKAGPLGSGTGALKRSIKYEKEGNSYVISAGGNIPKSQRPEHAYYQEFGFGGHWIHSSQATGNMKRDMVAKGKRFAFVKQYFPYMAPAFRKVQNRLRTELNRTGNKIIGA